MQAGNGIEKHMVSDTWTVLWFRRLFQNDPREDPLVIFQNRLTLASLNPSIDRQKLP